MIKDTLEIGWLAAKLAARLGADALKATKDAVVDNREHIAAGASGLVKAVGATTKAVGTGVARVSEAAADLASDAGDRQSGLARACLKTAAGVATGAELLGRGTSALGQGVQNISAPVGRVVGGAVTGGVGIVSESADGLVLTDAHLARKRAELARYGKALKASGEEQLRLLERTRKRRVPTERLDRVVIGGVTLASMLAAPASVPPEVQAAFEAAYPGLAQGETFAEAAARMSGEELPGLIAGVKGKLFELQFVDALNANGLPDGYTASLAGSATQPGWDIQILGPDGQVAELLQAKATESVGYVQAALERYPGIDVTTTSEVYAQLAALGAVEGVVDSGISEAGLEAAITTAADGADSGLSVLAPSVLGLAVIGLSVFMDRSLSGAERADLFGERSGRAGISTTAGHLVMIATQTWWLGLIGGVGTHWLASRGRAKREQLECLESLLDKLNGMEHRPALLPRTI